MPRKKLLNRLWVINRKLTGKQIQSIIILASAAGIRMHDDITTDMGNIGNPEEILHNENCKYRLGYYYKEDDEYYKSGELLIQYGVDGKDKRVTYKQVISALTREIKKNSRVE